MERLTKQLIKRKVHRMDRDNEMDQEYLPERIIQFGEGNFLRCFIDWMIHRMNSQGLFNGKVVAIQPTPHGKVVPKLNDQDGYYTVRLQGIEEAQVIKRTEIVSSISRGLNPYEEWDDVLKVAESSEIEFVFSNTTEAGLTYMKEGFNQKESPLSFPGKLTAFLYHRYLFFEGEEKAGLTILPCELVENNGGVLKGIVYSLIEDWHLPKDFKKWVEEANVFCNTLVDRIVTGYPRDEMMEYQSELNYEDQLLTVGEPYHLFVIESEGDLSEELPFQQAGLNVQWDSIKPYRELKVRLLNAPHTLFFSLGYLAGVKTVKELMDTPSLRTLLERAMFEEIAPLIAMPEETKSAFAKTVIDRFLNPFNNHYLIDIGLNAVSKFKTRVLPLLLEWMEKRQHFPETIVFSLASLCAYYRPYKKVNSQQLIGVHNGEEYPIRDSEEVIETFTRSWSHFDETDESLYQVVRKLLGNEKVWDCDLTQWEDLISKTHHYLKLILTEGVFESIEKIVAKVDDSVNEKAEVEFEFPFGGEL